MEGRISLDLFGEPIKQTLKEKYLVNPFSVIDLNDIKLRNRCKKYLQLGIKSEVGRNSVVYTASSSKDKEHIETLKNNWSEGVKKYRKALISNGSNGISIFNPFICEIMYRWFCPDNGKILDPFAGGSVRGIVANYLGYKYTGIELRQEQVDSNREQAYNILEINNHPQYYCGDSEKIIPELVPMYDMIFTCPPYANLEVYSNLPDDLSNMKYPEFLNKYESIIQKACNKLKKGGFAVFVVSEVRKTKNRYGIGYIGFVPDTIKAFEKCGMEYYNEIIMINNTANAGLRADKYMRTKKIVRIHQNILVFKK